MPGPGSGREAGELLWPKGKSGGDAKDIFPGVFLFTHPLFECDKQRVWSFVAQRPCFTSQWQQLKDCISLFQVIRYILTYHI